MFPERAVARAAGLKLGGGLAGFIEADGVGLAGGGGARIEHLEVVHRHGRRIREGPAVVLVEIWQVGLLALQLGDELAHLQAPVAEMHVADHAVAHEAMEALQRVTDDE